MEAREDFVTAIADDFVEPGAAVDFHEKGAAHEIDRLGVSGDVWIEEIVPDFEDFKVRLLFVEVDLFDNGGNEIGNFLGCGPGSAFGFTKVSAAPFFERLFFGVGLGKAFFWNGPRWPEHSQRLVDNW